MKLYTKTGDTGTTSLTTGDRVSKTDARIEAVGTIDELNCSLGVALTEIGESSLRPIIGKIQSQLFVLGSQLATPTDADSEFKKNLPKILLEDSTELEQTMDMLADKTPALTRFVLPGGSKLAAQLHFARSICRRAERRMVALENIDPSLLRFINRLSDFLFAAARFANHETSTAEILWEPK